MSVWITIATISILLIALCIVFVCLIVGHIVIVKILDHFFDWDL